jgi:hypothetical protein
MRDVVMSFFEGAGIKVEPGVAGDPGDEGVLRVGFIGENGCFSCAARVDEETGVLSFYTLCPFSVPQGRMAQALELVARLNWGHALGALELDVDTGELRFKTSIDVEGAGLDEALVGNLVYANVASIDSMLPALTAALVQGASVRAALASIQAA